MAMVIEASTSIRGFLCLLPCAVFAIAPAPAAAQTNFIHVTTPVQGDSRGLGPNGGPLCSLGEAIYAANTRSNDALDASAKLYISGCETGTGNDTIVLISNAVYAMTDFVHAIQHSRYGPTATPVIFSNITIQGNGATIQRAAGSPKMRAFTVGFDQFDFNPGGTPDIVSGWGNLTLENATILGFTVQGGDGGVGGGGGGMGAGGAIYVDGSGSSNVGLTVINSTFQNNGATGGNGGAGANGGGGGGLAGAGGIGGLGGAGGGGSFGNGGAGQGCCAGGDEGGGGGGTDSSGQLGGGAGFCGGTGGDGGFVNLSGNGNNGKDAACPGGGGGGGGAQDLTNNLAHGGNGGNGSYGGGGGGGGADDANGGAGGFGGGGGSSAVAACCNPSGGNGGFGGGGGVFSSGIGGQQGNGGPFGGGGGIGADGGGGGGGAALGGAIFGDSSTVLVQNSTFFNNFVTRGNKGGPLAANGSDGGGAIFVRNGSLTVQDVTISGNQATGSGGGIVVYQAGSNPTSFTLLNTIIANNGLAECSVLASSVTSSGFAGNLIENNDPNNPCQLSGPSSGVVSNGDPQLGPLLNNGGLTMTMAIPKTSPAWGAADQGSSLPTDQRGFPRPSQDGHGFDIGAFELCTPARPTISPFPCALTVETFGGAELTIQVSPAGGGTTSPVGMTNYPSEAVAAIQAMPNPGYRFNGWTGSVTDPANPSTTVIMNRDQAVTANFVPCNCVTDVSSFVTVTRGGYVLNLITGRFAQTVTVTNTSTTTFIGPISLVLDNLSSNATLFNATGTTDSLEPPSGSRYINANFNIAAGQMAAFSVQFTDPTHAAISYTTRVLAGPGPR